MAGGEQGSPHHERRRGSSAVPPSCASILGVVEKWLRNFSLFAACKADEALAEQADGLVEDTVQVFDQTHDKFQKAPAIRSFSSEHVFNTDGAAMGPDGIAAQLANAAPEFATEERKADFRKVRIEDVYDFHDPIKRRLSTIGRAEFETPESIAVPLDNPSYGPSPASSRSSSPASSQSGTPPGTPPMSPRGSNRQLDEAARSAIRETNWGVIVGKVLRCKANGIENAAYKMLQRRALKESVAKAKKLPQRLTSVQNRAAVVVHKAKALGRRIATIEQDMFDCDWEEGGLLVHLFGEEYMDTLMLFATTARKVLETQPIVAQAVVPCKVFGDLHGQLRDLLFHFRAFGAPGEKESSKSMSFVFNGDFVDRGSHQLEVVGLLLALKVLMPERVWLVRGNHEDRAMNERYGFQKECDDVLGSIMGPKTYEIIHRAFDYLPIACIISGHILVVHGGIGHGTWKISDLNHVKRPIGEEELTDPSLNWVRNILWSDPTEDGEFGSKGAAGVHTSPRCSDVTKFGWNVTKMFCAVNGLSLIIRSHQCKYNGRGFDTLHDNLLVRVFSARDYEECGNDGAVLNITLDKSKVSTGHGGQIVVRPQVLGSLTKAQEAVLREGA